MSKCIDLTGQKFGRLTVIERSGTSTSKTKRALWLCECDCGKNIIVNTDSLKSGNTKSCGCLNKEQRIVNGCKNKKCNAFGTTDNITIMKDNNNNKCLIDTVDVKLIEKYYWFRSKSGYWHSEERKEGRTFRYRLNRFLLDYPEGKVVDHINRNTDDNRRENLRAVTDRENSLNSNKQSNNTSGIMGVNWLKNNKKWQAVINLGKGNRKYLGSFTNKEEAIKVRLQAEKEYYGDFAPQRHLFEQYEISQGKE